MWNHGDMDNDSTRTTTRATTTAAEIGGGSHDGPLGYAKILIITLLFSNLALCLYSSKCPPDRHAVKQPRTGKVKL